MWKMDKGKSYGTPTEEAHYFNNFKANYDKVSADDSTEYKLSLNKFADLSFEEFSGLYLGVKSSPVSKSYCKNKEEEQVDQSVTSIDWQKLNKVTAVRDQGQCGSCWAFSTMASVESRMVMNGSADVNSLDLSEQQLVDCSNGYKRESGCDGGMMVDAFQYLHTKQASGVASEQSYPYKARDSKCKKNQQGVEGSTTWDACYTAKTCAGLQSRLTKAPASVGVNATDKWQLYESGVLKATKQDCGSVDDINHGVFAVGFDTEQGFWRIKNSWGASWGENGYIRLSTNSKCKGDAQNAYQVCRNVSYVEG